MRLIRTFSDVMLRIVVVGLLIGCTGAAAAKADDGLDRLRAAAEQGDAAAQYQLGTRYLEKSDGAARRRDPTAREEDNQEAIKWLRLAAEHGNVDAQARLGVLYAYGGVVSRDPAEAAKWTRLAAEQGNRNAMLRLAEMYSEGRGVPRDPGEAKRWIQRNSASAPRKVNRPELLLAAIGLTVLAFAAALFSTAAGEAGNLWASVILASLALLMAAFVGLVTVPYLARRVTIERLRHSLRYEVTRAGVIYVLVTLVIGIAALNTGNNLLYIVVAAMLAAILVS